MRIATITLDGEDHPLCFSAGVMEDICERYGDLAGMFDTLNGSAQVKEGKVAPANMAGQVKEGKVAPANMAGQLKTIYWLLASMMGAGARYIRRKGGTCPDPLTVEDIRDVCDIADFAGIKNKVLETITAGSTREVEAEQKNQETTQANLTAL